VLRVKISADIVDLGSANRWISTTPRSRPAWHVINETCEELAVRPLDGNTSAYHRDVYGTQGCQRRSDRLTMFDQLNAQALMVALSVVMSEILADVSVEGSLPEKDHTIKAF